MDIWNGHMINMAVNNQYDDSLKSTFKSVMSMALRACDEQHKIVYWNKGCELLYGYSEEEALGQRLESLIVPVKEISNNQIEHQRWLNGGCAPLCVEQTMITKSGDSLAIVSNYFMLIGQLRDSEVSATKEYFNIDIAVKSAAAIQANLDASNNKLQSVFEATPDLYFFLNNEREIVDYQSNKDEELYIAPDRFLGRKMEQVLPTKTAELFRKNLELVACTNQMVTFEYYLILHKSKKHYEARMNKLRGGMGYLIIVRDITERVVNQQSLEIAEQWKKDLFNNSSSVIYTKDLQGKYTSVNAAFEHLLEVRPEQVIGKNDYELYSHEVAEILRKNDRKALSTNGPIDVEEFVSDDRGHYIYQSIKFPLKNEHGEVYGICGISTDITQRKQAEIEVLQHAHFDSLTGLPNRSLMLERLSQLIDEAKRNSEKFAVLFIDLDDFKKINDSLGHEIGDRLLIECSNILKDSIGRTDTVGRLGGDEFMLLLRNTKDQAEIMEVLENILSRFKLPFKIEDRELILTLSVGIAVYPDDGDSASALLRNSDTAMFKAKSLGRDTYSFFTEEMNRDVIRRLSLEEQIHGALERDEFEVFYQPQICVATGRIIGAEALLRWNNCVLGNVSPMEFIPVAEYTGLIVEIGRFVLEQALVMLARWQGLTGEHIRIAVNLSPKQFKDTALVADIKAQIEKVGVTPASLELEITEGVLLTGLSSIDEALKELGDLGVVLSMDDFGTGYSSLSYLRQYPFDVVKIDRTFVIGITEVGADKELVSATIAMAHRLGLKVVAEGVETQDQLDALRRLQCDYAQGYFLGKPMPVGDLFNFLKQKKRAS